MSLYHIFEDAHRRVCIAESRSYAETGKEANRERIWTGMQYPSGMKEAVEKGIMRPLDKETPRILGWYCFTELGWKMYDMMFKDAPDYFSEAFKTYSWHNKYSEARELLKQPSPTTEEEISASAPAFK